MRSFFSRLKRSQLVKGTVFVFLASNTANFGNLLYNLLMGRLLTPIDYANLGALFSIVSLFSVPISVIQITLVKKVSSLWAGNKIPQIAYLSKKYTLRLIFAGLAISSVFIIMGNQIVSFLDLKNIYPLFFISIILILSFAALPNRSILQGALFFPYIALNSLSEIGMKLAISVFLVILNYGLLGALTGNILSGAGALLLTILEMKVVLKVKKEEKQVNISIPLKMYKTFLPAFITILTLTLFFTSDIILVKHFFPNSAAADYVALSTLGKIIFYALGPVISVMFPLISQRAEKGTPYLLPLLGTLALTLGISSFLIFIYFFIPGFIISVFYGGKYQTIIPYMGIFSFYITLYSVNSILTYFLLSVSYHKPIYILFIVSLFQSIAIYFFHGSIPDIIWVNIIVSLCYLLIASSAVFYKERMIISKMIIRACSR